MGGIKLNYRKKNREIYAPADKGNKFETPNELSKLNFHNKF